jgi:MFS family permease
MAGVLTQAFGWRAVFWFLAIIASINFLSFLLFLKDTFRRQRSLVFQTILKKRMKNSEVTIMEGRKSVNMHINNGTSPANTPDAEAGDDIKLSLMDVNPFPPYFRVLQRWNNIAILIPSGENVSEHRHSRLQLRYRPSLCDDL